MSDRFLQSLQRFYLYKKSSVSSAAWQKRCSFSNADFALDLTVRSCRTCQNHPHHGCARCGPGPAGGRWDHAGRWQIRAPARWTGGHSRGRHCGCHRGYHAGDGCCCRGNHRRGGYRCGGPRLPLKLRPLRLPRLGPLRRPRGASRSGRLLALGSVE